MTISSTHSKSGMQSYGVTRGETDVKLEMFLQGSLQGWGVARDPFGRILRRFQIEMHGVWSDEHRAIHLDESYTYVGGPKRQRRWTVHTDEQGHILGHDAVEAARLVGLQKGVDFELRFDRLQTERSRWMEPVHIVQFLEVGDAETLMLGRVRRWGIVIATTHVALRRIA